APERLLGGSPVPAGRAPEVAAGLEVGGEHHGVGLAGALQPLAGQAVAELLVLLGEGGVGGLAHERVAERELLLAGEARRRAADHELLPGELGEAAAELGRVAE